MKTWNAKFWLAALALQLPPCVAADNAPAAVSSEATPSDDVAPAVGSLTLQWTLSGRRDPVDCGALGSERFYLSLQAAGSSPDDEDFEAPCDAFEVSLDLPPGAYQGEAVLVDRFDRPVTLNVPLEQIVIVAGRNVMKSIDFPVTAFLSGS